MDILPKPKTVDSVISTSKKTLQELDNVRIQQDDIIEDEQSIIAAAESRKQAAETESKRASKLVQNFSKLLGE